MGPGAAGSVPFRHLPRVKSRAGSSQGHCVRVEDWEAWGGAREAHSDPTQHSPKGGGGARPPCLKMNKVRPRGLGKGLKERKGNCHQPAHGRWTRVSPLRRCGIKHLEGSQASGKHCSQGGQPPGPLPPIRAPDSSRVLSSRQPWPSHIYCSGYCCFLQSAAQEQVRPRPPSQRPLHHSLCPERPQSAHNPEFKGQLAEAPRGPGGSSTVTVGGVEARGLRAAWHKQWPPLGKETGLEVG